MDRAAAIENLHSATAVYTSIHVVDALLDRLDWPLSGGRLLDPSAGDGSFLLRALNRLNAKEAGAIERIQGWEIHPGAADIARFRITQHLRQQGLSPAASRKAANRIVINKDFLTDGPPHAQFRIIAGNPPYLRFQRIPDYFKTIYTDCLPKYANADLLHAFLDYCTRILPDNGAIGLVCSDRFLFNENATNLRREMGNRVAISHLSRLDPTTSFYKPKLRNRGTPPRIHPVTIVLKPVAPGYFPMTGEPISPDELGRQETTGPKLTNIARVSIAPWLGPLGIFVVKGEDAQFLLSQGTELIPAVDTDDIDPTNDVLRPHTRFAIRTSRQTEPEDGSALRSHLQTRRQLMPKRGLDRPYWVSPEPINLTLEKPSLLIPRIARRLRAVILPPGVLPINHNLSVVNTTTEISLDDLRHILLRDESQDWIRRNAPRLESGFFSISTRLLRRLPI